MDSICSAGNLPQIQMLLKTGIAKQATADMWFTWLVTAIKQNQFFVVERLLLEDEVAAHLEDCNTGNHLDALSIVTTPEIALLLLRHPKCNPMNNNAMSIQRALLESTEETSFFPMLFIHHPKVDLSSSIDRNQCF